MNQEEDERDDDPDYGDGQQDAGEDRLHRLLPRYRLAVYCGIGFHQPLGCGSMRRRGQTQRSVWHCVQKSVPISRRGYTLAVRCSTSGNGAGSGLRGWKLIWFPVSNLRSPPE